MMTKVSRHSGQRASEKGSGCLSAAGRIEYRGMEAICGVTIALMLTIQLIRYLQLDLGFIQGNGLNFGAQILLTFNLYLAASMVVNTRWLLLACNIFVASGLVIWEFYQQSLEYKIFDELDLAATLLGTCALFLYDLYFS